MSKEEQTALIGSYKMKAGFSGDDAPQAVFRTLVGHYVQRGCVGMCTDDLFCIESVNLLHFSWSTTRIKYLQMI